MMNPRTEAELAGMVGAATGPLRIVGGGTRDIGRPVTGEALSTRGLSGVTLYEPGALTIVVQAGTPLAEVEALLRGERQRLAFEPMDHRGLLGTEGEPTIGGVVAANVSGSRRVQVGAARDFLLGVRFVDGQGTILKNGGRVMKNVTGYDLVKLMTGSWGTLGVLTEVSLKVLPIPETQSSLILRGLADFDAVRAMSAALGSPFEVSGAAHCAKVVEGGPVTLLRVEGSEASVRYRLDRLREMMAGLGAPIEQAGPEMSDWVWQSVRDVTMMADQPGDVWRVSCKPSDAPGLAERSGARGWYFDWGGGLVWVRMPEGQDLRARLGAFDGHATLIRAAAETRARIAAFHPEPEPVARLTAGLRARFDPRGVLNPGLMG